MSCVVALAAVAKLVGQPLKAAFVQHFVKPKSVRKQAGRFRAQKQPFDLDVPLGNVGRHDQKTEAIDAPLKSAIGLFAWNHL